MSGRISQLKLKKARLISDLEQLSHPSELMYANFGRVCYDIILEEKKEVRETVNNLEDEKN